jgi:hypothetical protein
MISAQFSDAGNIYMDVPGAIVFPHGIARTRTLARGERC